MLPFQPLEVYPLMYTKLPSSTGIYAIVNHLNDKFYIGSAKTVNRLPSKSGFRNRFNGHRSRLRRNEHHSKHLQRSYNYYVGDLGLDPDDVFEIWILEYVEPELCIVTEQYYLDNYEYDYNESSIAHTTNGNKGRNFPQDHCDKIAEGLRGQAHTDERKKNISEALKASPRTKEKIAVLAEMKAKEYVGISPEGEVVYFRNAVTFANKHNLSSGSISACALGRAGTKNRIQHKGWKFYFREEYEAFNGVMPEIENRGLKSYVAISPTGNRIFFTNAQQFIRDYPECKFRASGITNCANGGQDVHKGWQFFHKEDYDAMDGNVPIVEDKKLKSYIGISPTGDRVYFTNANQFIRDYPEYNFYRCCITDCIKGRLKTHKGWKFYYANEYDERLLA